MKVQVLQRGNLNNTLQEKNYLNFKGTINSFLQQEIRNYDNSAPCGFIALVNDVVIEREEWSKYELKDKDKLTFILEPQVTTAIATWIMVGLSLASLIYSFYMMSKLKGKQGSNPSSGRTIYDVNAQGNQVKLQDVIPENFGTFKRYPDYIADIHSYYQDNKRVADYLLCQGVGYFVYDTGGADTFIGDTSVNKLPGIQLQIFEPGVSIAETSTIDDEIYYCWYNSTEVTESGKTIGDQFVSSGNNPVYLNCDQFMIGAMGQEADFEVGDIIELSGVPDRIKLLPDKIWEDTTDTIITQSSFNNYEDFYGRAGAILYFYKDEAGNEFLKYAIVPSNYFNRCSFAACEDYFWGDRDKVAGRFGCSVSNFYYRTNQSGNMGGFDSAVIREELKADGVEDVSTSEYVWYRRLLIDKDSENMYDDLADNVHFEFYTETGTPVGSGVGGISNEGREYFSAYQQYKVTCSQDEGVFSRRIQGGFIAYAQGVSDSYKGKKYYGITSDNGLYKIVSIKKLLMTDDNLVKHYATAYKVRPYINGEAIKLYKWSGFWARSTFSTNYTVNIHKFADEDKDLMVGPYRAAPYGSVCSVFEIDIQAPGGLYHLSDTGEYEKHSVTIEILYRVVGDSEWEGTRKVTLVGYNADQLGHTERIYIRSGAKDYEVALRRVTKSYKGDSSYSDTVKWVGLKSRLEESPKSYSGVTTLTMRVTGNETLSDMNSNQISTVWTRKLPKLTSDELEPTANLAHAMKYILTSSKFGNIWDAENLQYFDDYWAAKGICFNGAFDTDNTLLDAITNIAEIGYAEPVVDGNRVLLSTRERFDTEDYSTAINNCATLFHSGNTTSITYDYAFQASDDVKEICVQYTDPKTFKTATVYISISQMYLYNEDSNLRYNDGILDFTISTYPRTNNYETIDAFGVTDYAHAVSLGKTRLQYLWTIKEEVTIKTELYGANCRYNDLVAIKLPRPSDNHVGDAIAIPIINRDGNYVRLGREIASDFNLSTSSQFGWVNAKNGKPIFTTVQKTTDRFTFLIKSETTEWEWDEEYGKSLEFPTLVVSQSNYMFFGWVKSIETDEYSTTIKVINYSHSIFNDRLEDREGFGISAFGTSGYGLSY